MKSIESLHEIKKNYTVFLFDQWGVIHNGKNLYPNVEKIFKDLLEEDKLIYVISNSGKKSSDNIRRLQQMGAENILRNSFSDILSKLYRPIIVPALLIKISRPFR